MKLSPLTIALLSAMLLQERLASPPITSVVGHDADGRYLEAYEVAAKYIRAGGTMGLPERYRKVENYSVRFEGEKDGCYLLWFNPKREPGFKPSMAFLVKDGLPLLFEIRKSDLKLMHAYVE